MRIKIFGEKRNIYFVGIGGISMSALAKMLKTWGYAVCGYDAAQGRQVRALTDCGISVEIGGECSEMLMRAEIVVYTDAVPQNDVRLTYARNAGKMVLSRADLLSVLCGQFSRVIAVAGSHGKTTCTAMCAHILKETGVPFAAHIGGEDFSLDNFTMTGTEFLVTEACEYKKNLSKIHADSAILLNVDKDHLECYSGVEELKQHFFDYVKAAKTSFLCADDVNCRKFIEKNLLQNAILFGCDDINNDYNATEIKRTVDGYKFCVTEYGKRLCHAQIHVAGRHNVYNALAAFACLRSYGFDERQIVEGLRRFKGIRRRFERLGEAYGAMVIADYAHHPREIAATLCAAEEFFFTKKDKGKLFVVFQPHTYSRTKMLMEEFVEVLQGVENLVVYRTFAARESYDEEGSAKALSDRLGNAIYADNVHTLETYLKTSVKETDVVLFLGAGDVYTVAQYLSQIR